MNRRIPIAIAGAGNCASSLIQGIEYYRNHDTAEGLIHHRVGPYAVSDIEVVAVFDVDKRKVGKDVAGILQTTGAEILLCYLPVGSAQAVRFYAQAALDAGTAFINAIPEFICS